ncbi:FAD-dependent monooxygenase [Gluconacetobacter takamatsuzukensis]|uniref:Monooxygenase n=1 Tax=Gluconacetobacter takamatsuzukensis TaxID=1286190 RepID=A0A7W4KFE7_9PROT|nr:FAD-dependent monooxygenase [Gluconacetobacter takamatsuzukensis]MBB2205880.1 monooxygenase [Gluconacetobacter takamatsuzukensis]
MPKPVLVVGAGPVGLAMAAELARYRVPVRIIDRSAARSDTSKALAVWARTLELLAGAGCVDAFLAAGFRAEAIGIHAGGRLIGRVPFDRIASPFNVLLVIPQSETERLLEAHLASLGGTVERNVELVAFTDTRDGVTCVVRHASGAHEHIHAGWLIGCDGAHSLVRRTLGMPFEGDTLSTSFLIADVQIAGLGIPPAELAIFWHPDGALMIFPISPGRYRIIADIGARSGHPPSFEQVQAIVARRGPGGLTVSDPVWLSHFGVNERKVRDYRAGRVFLAGDAAHVHSPAGGQGMNTGMQDAFNLAWKLALVEQGQAGPALLDSYSAERSPVARHILAESSRLTRIVLLRTPLAQRLRGFVAHRILAFPKVRRAIVDRLSEITLAYPDSPLNTGSAKGLHGPAPGRRFMPDGPVQVANAPRFVLYAREDVAARAMIARHPSLLDFRLHMPPDENGIWLVRPDGYVAATARAGHWSVIEDALSKIAANAAHAVNTHGAADAPGVPSPPGVMPG